MRISDWSSDVCSSDLEEKEPGVASFEDLIGLFAVIAGQVVEDHDVARIQRRRELGFDVDSKDLFGHRPADDPGSSQAIAESLAQRILRPPAIAAKAVGFGLTIGRASCRESVCQDVYISVFAVSLKKKNKR